MPLWGHVELLCRAITEAGVKEAEKLLEQASQQAENTVRDTAQQADRQYQEKRLSRKIQAVAEARQMVDTAELAAKRRVMIFHRQLIQEVMDALTERLKRFRTQPDYERFLISAAQEAIGYLASPEVIIEVAEHDVDIILSRLDELSHNGTPGIHIRSTNAFDGGIRVFTADNKMMFDNSITARCSRMENDIRQEIWRTIGESHIRQD
jgi:vacuolar-type H+-ATPase subunit E/Vma4